MPCTPLVAGDSVDCQQIASGLESSVVAAPVQQSRIVADLRSPDQHVTLRPLNRRPVY